MIRTIGVSPLLAVLSLLPGLLVAQRPDVEPGDSIEAIPLQGVLVEVTRGRQELTVVPQAVSIVGEQEIRLDQRKLTIDEALRSVPGVYATNRHNFTQGEGIRLSIRAPQARIGTRGLQLLQDGIPLTTADGTTLPNNLDLGSAGRIEVIRGPSSVLYGNSAGGVVAVQTQYPADQPLLIRPELQFGSFGYNRQQLLLEGTAGPYAYIANVDRMELDGFREYGGAEIRRANLQARSLFGERTVVRGIFNLFDMPFAENSSTLTLEDARENPRSVRAAAFEQGWGKTVTQGQGGLQLEHDIAGAGIARVLGWGAWRENWNPIPARIIDLGRTAAGLRSEYQSGGALGPLSFEWTAGFDLSYQRDDRREFANAGVDETGGRAREGALQLDQLEEVFSFGPFVQATFHLLPRVALTSGIRYDRYHFQADDHFLVDGDESGQRRLSAAGPMVGLTYTPLPQTNLFANFASAYQTPTTVELSNRPDGGGGFNEDLEAEYIRSFELGVRGTIPALRLRYEIAGYLSTVENALLRYEGLNEQAFFRNAGETSRDGLEIALDWEVLPALRARAAYTYQDFVFVHYQLGGVDYSGNREPGAPSHSLFTGLTYTAPFGMTSAVDLRWMDAYPANDANTAHNWAFTVIDARLGWEMPVGGVRLRPFVGVENLFDERYNASVLLNAVANRFFEPAPGRSFYLGLSAPIGL